MPVTGVATDQIVPRGDERSREHGPGWWERDARGLLQLGARSRALLQADLRGHPP